MRDLSALLTPHPFPAALTHIRQSFAREPDCQTCGAAAMRHGLLLGGLTVPTSAPGSSPRHPRNQGTPPDSLRGCLKRLGLEADVVRKVRGNRQARFSIG